MSKTQDKKAARIAEAREFVRERREVQLAIFESNFNVGLQLFEDKKAEMSPEEIELIESEIVKNRQLIDEYRASWGL